jgi:hypothetical protein
MNRLVKVLFGFLLFQATLTVSALESQGLNPLKAPPPNFDPEPIPVECLDLPAASVCAGDTVIPEDFTYGTATVIAVSERYREVLVRGDIDGRNYRRSIRQLFLTSGCINEVCVNLAVIPDFFSYGTATVIAIHFNQDLTLIRGDMDGRYYKPIPDDLAVTEGCLYRFCVRDIVIPADFTRGTATIVGINFARRFFVVRGDIDGRIYRRYEQQLYPAP